MDYDVLILGGGIVGCSVAYEMSKYNLNVALIEKDFDIADDTFVNTTVVYDGSETTNTVMSSLEKIGSELVKEDCEKFNVYYKKTGSLRIADTDEGVRELEQLYEKSILRGIDKVSLIDPEEAYKIEPNLNENIKKALYSENVSIIAPYDLAISYAEVAAENGVNFRFEEKVLNISNISRGFKVTTNKNKFTCRVVINTIPDDIYLESDNIAVNKYETEDCIKNMSYYIIDDKIDKKLNKVVVKIADKNSFIINIPDISDGSIIGMKDSKASNLDEGINYAKTLLQDIEKDNVSNIFKEEYKKDLMLIDDRFIEKGYIRVTGKHYGKITLAPAIARSISDAITSNLNITKKKDFIDKRRKFYRFRDMTDEERNEIIAVDNRYGNIICQCNQVTEGEIIDAIRRPLGARTLQGIKRRTGAALGSCHGSYCVRKMIKILAREMDKKQTLIVEDSKKSRVWISRIKEFDEV